MENAQSAKINWNLTARIIFFCTAIARVVFWLGQVLIALAESHLVFAK